MGDPFLLDDALHVVGDFFNPRSWRWLRTARLTTESDRRSEYVGRARSFFDGDGIEDSVVYPVWEG